MPALPSERCDLMKETDIRKYAELMKELELTGLEVTTDNSRLRLERSVTMPLKEAVYSFSESPAAAQPSPAAQHSPAVQLSSEPKDYTSVKSPMVGVFYAAPAENAAPYVSVGDTVTKGQVLCVIEAMKMMNEITAEEDGVISEICVANGKVVEYGTELFRIKR